MERLSKASLAKGSKLSVIRVTVSARASSASPPHIFLTLLGRK
jgi:hypothetical protein